MAPPYPTKENAMTMHTSSAKPVYMHPGHTGPPELPCNPKPPLLFTANRLADAGTAPVPDTRRCTDRLPVRRLQSLFPRKPCSGIAKLQLHNRSTARCRPMTATRVILGAVRIRRCLTRGGMDRRQTLWGGRRETDWVLLSAALYRSASAHVVTSMNRAGCYQPKATIVGLVSHPLRRRAFPRRTAASRL